ncbi:hypothetical protein Hanom_Chr03g00209531 [Helianthus anomalus]
MIHQLTFLGIEEHESFVEGNCVIIGWRRAFVMPRHILHYDRNNPHDEGGCKNRPHRPDKDLTADDDATQIHIPLLLLFSGTQQPALLRLIQRSRKRRPVQLVQVPAPIIVCR